jgi:hypothetical protein
MSEDNKDLIDSVERIRGRFKTELEDPDKVQLSFIDELNELIRKIFKDDPMDVYTALSPGELEKWKRAKFRRWISRSVRKINVR